MTLIRISVLTAMALAFGLSALADVNGKWTAEFETPIGTQKYIST